MHLIYNPSRLIHARSQVRIIKSSKLCVKYQMLVQQSTVISCITVTSVVNPRTQTHYTTEFENYKTFVTFSVEYSRKIVI